METKAAEVESIVRNVTGPSALNHSPRDVPCHHRQRQMNNKSAVSTLSETNSNSRHFQVGVLREKLLKQRFPIN